MFLKDYISDVVGGVKSLLTGMKITGRYALHHGKEKITQQYPDNKDTLVLPERFRGEVIMLHDENNEHACTGCTACELACPNGTIKIITKFDVDEATGKRKKHWIHLSITWNCVRFVTCVLKLVPPVR